MEKIKKVPFIPRNLISTSIILLLSFFVSCEDEGIEKDKEVVAADAVAIDDSKDRANARETTKNRIEFSKALASAVYKEPALREFIRTEALKTFDGDFDILYGMVKDQILSNGKSFRNTILPYFEKEKDLDLVEARLPLLTLMIPSLPENSFSADNWNTSTQIPTVGVDAKAKDGISIFVGGETEVQEFSIPYNNAVPAFPIIFIKDNERVVASKSQNHKLQIGKFGQTEYSFRDELFNKKLKRSEPESGRKTKYLDDKVIAAYKMGMEWQRDYIYYNLTPSRPSGPFSYDFKEFVTSFRFNTGDGLKLISDYSDDPKALASTSPSQGWTDGLFEFKLTALINSTITGPLTHSIFEAKGSDLFDIVYEKRFVNKVCSCVAWCCTEYYVYIPQTATPKNLLLDKRVELLNWDLYTYAFTMSIKIEEFDDTVTETFQEKNSSQLATNFSADGEIMKIGLKFGGSSTKSIEQTYTRTVTHGSDYLGETLVNFGDQVIVKSEKNLFGVESFYTREYSTGVVTFSLEPLRVQN